MRVRLLFVVYASINFVGLGERQSKLILETTKGFVHN